MDLLYRASHRASPPPRPPRPQTGKKYNYLQLKAMFRLADLDNSGSIDFNEFLHAQRRVKRCAPYCAWSQGLPCQPRPLTALLADYSKPRSSPRVTPTPCLPHATRHVPLTAYHLPPASQYLPLPTYD